MDKQNLLRVIKNLEEAIDSALNAADSLKCVPDTLESEFYDLVFPSSDNRLLPEELANKLEDLYKEYS